MRSLRRFGLGVLVLVAGCTASGGGGGGGVGRWVAGDVSLAGDVRREPWIFRGASGEVLTSTHYRLRTTIVNAGLRGELVLLLEGAHGAYRSILPEGFEPRPLRAGPMDAWVFADREQYLAYVRQSFGPAGAIYTGTGLRGFAVGDRFVAYHRAEQETWSVTGHEGFHQWLGRYFVGRVPPFLDEGLATTFERVRWEGTGAARRPAFNPSYNPQRAQELRNVLDARAGMSLELLMQSEPGAVSRRGNSAVLAFYAQSWAFARFVQEYDGGRYRERFRRWMADTAAGTLTDPGGTHRVRQEFWNPRAVRPIVEHYLGTDLPTLEKEFVQWCRYLAYEEFNRQWGG